MLERYLHQVEPVRLAVNRLLDTADPILTGYTDHRIAAPRAANRMGRLETRFAAYAVDVAAITPGLWQLRPLQAQYAHTYVLEDAYLSALVSGLAGRDLGHLPDTQAAQRSAIIAWRIGLSVLARQLHIGLPSDLQQAGRGEIAPFPGRG